MNGEDLEAVNGALVQFCWRRNTSLIQFVKLNGSAASPGKVVAVESDAVKLTCDDAHSWAERCWSGEG